VTTANTSPRKSNDLNHKEWVGLPDGRQVLIGQAQDGQWFAQTPTRDGKGVNFYSIGDEYSSAMKASVRAKIEHNAYSTIYDSKGSPIANRQNTDHPITTGLNKIKGKTIGLVNSVLDGSAFKNVTPEKVQKAAVTAAVLVPALVPGTYKSNTSKRIDEQWVGLPDGRQILIGMEEGGRWIAQTPTSDGKGVNTYPIGYEYSLRMVANLRNQN
jgi:hypothetical protein